jgi:hypothetical protein
MVVTLIKSNVLSMQFALSQRVILPTGRFTGETSEEGALDQPGISLFGTAHQAGKTSGTTTTAFTPPLTLSQPYENQTTQTPDRR